MSAPRLEIDLGKIEHNARTLVDRLGRRGIGVTGLVDATLGSAAIAQALLRAGVKRLGDSRIENIETLRRAGIRAPMTLVRSPMPSQVQRVVASADVSFNTELEVVASLSAAACRAGRTHGVVLTVGLGDLRGGIAPEDLHGIVRETLRLPNIALVGIGANRADRSGTVPDRRNTATLSALADSLEVSFGDALGGPLGLVSGGNSGSLDWALGGADPGRINDLRLGESILLGRDPLRRDPIDALHTDAIRFVAEVIESNEKPSRPRNRIARRALGEVRCSPDRGRIRQAILGVGRQDIDPEELRAPAGIEVCGATTDHLVIESGQHRLDVGAEITFELGHESLPRAMMSPFVRKVTVGARDGAAADEAARAIDSMASPRIPPPTNGRTTVSAPSRS